MLKWFFFLIVFCNTSSLFSQLRVIKSNDFDEPPKAMSEVLRLLGPDSVAIYFNDNYKMVRVQCATLFRITKIDSVSSFFTGGFKDYYPDSLLAISGNYEKEKKEGFFQFYYPNGQLEKSGNYVKDKKKGTWNYYYEDGSKRQVFDYKENEILIVEFWDEKGRHLVDAGNGEWFGYDSNAKFSRVKGKVVNGQKAGVWEKDLPGRSFVLNRENFANGQFTNGNANSFVNGIQAYNNLSFCVIEQAEPFLEAEYFEVDKCTPRFNPRWVLAKYPGGDNHFYKELKEKLILINSLKISGTIAVQTIISADGKMTNFQPVSKTGLEEELIKVLQTMRNWKPTKINGKSVSQKKVIRFEMKE